jgi:hypothetical protein
MSATAELRARVGKALREDDFSAALAAISATISRALGLALENGSLCYGSGEVDRLCLLVGRKWLDKTRPDRRGAASALKPLDLYIASHLQVDGGHTPLIGDFIRSMPGRSAILALTNIEDAFESMPETILQRVGLTSHEVELCSKIAPVEKLAWLIDLLDRHRPDRIFLFNHHHDVVAIAACQPEVRREVVFVHHADRLPSVGAFLQSAIHVDVTPFCFNCCRHGARISDNRFIPLVANDEGVRTKFSDRHDFQKGFHGLRTAAAGSQRKFLGDSSPSYPDAIAAVLKLTKGWHVHIGDLDRDKLTHFRSVLSQLGVGPDRFVHVPWVPSVWQAMSQYEVDVYIGSFPVRGARTSVEVMGSGTPALWHVADSATWFHDTHMKYQGAEVWRTVDDLCRIIRGVDEAWMTRQAHLARSHYERNHAPALLAAYLPEKDIPGHPAPTVSKYLVWPRPVSLDRLLA